MQAQIWLKIEAIKKYGGWKAGHVQAFKTKPSTSDREMSVKITIDIPDEVFEEPVFEAKLVLPKTTRQLPDMTTIGNEVSKELSKHMGFKVKLEMPSPPEETLAR